MHVVKRLMICTIRERNFKTGSVTNPLFLALIAKFSCSFYILYFRWWLLNSLDFLYHITLDKRQPWINTVTTNQTTPQRIIHGNLRRRWGFPALSCDCHQFRAFPHLRQIFPPLSLSSLSIQSPLRTRCLLNVFPGFTSSSIFPMPIIAHTLLHRFLIGSSRCAFCCCFFSCEWLYDSIRLTTVRQALWNLSKSKTFAIFNRHNQPLLQLHSSAVLRQQKPVKTR